ncbi:ParB/RepB/Spo0J family partition protein [Nocardioides campestrisoli]|uniref:ParB/RepB/Spo0J family partition protein n=1 Tax=Nocardioides campestrisoli TaxID=2736757 RepID=UPI0015E63AF7|nr:ParB/RepB/Spo0J family partition protein [Nocardioides campestrisoli]
MSNPTKPVRRGLGRGLGALIPTGPPVESDADAGTARGMTPGSGEVAGPAGELGRHLASASDEPQRSEAVQSAGRESAGAPESADPTATPAETVAGAYFREIPIEQVRPNQWQPRQVFEEDALAELVHSIREVGLLQPVVVRPADEGGYELIMGERRWRASQEAGLERIPAIVRETEDGDMLRDALLENLHRSQLNPLEEAAAYGQLLEDFGCTHEELAQRIGRSRPQISNTLRLLKLSPAVQRRVAAGVLSAGHARALLAVEDGDLQDRLAARVVAEGISVRALEEIVAVGDHGRPGRAARRSKPVAPGLTDLADRLADRFETRVKVDLGKSKGKITVEFASMDDLRRIVAVMDPRNTDDRPI